MYAGQFLSRMFSASQRPRNVRDFGNCRKFLQHVFAPLLHFQPVLPDPVFSDTPDWVCGPIVQPVWTDAPCSEIASYNSRRFATVRQSARQFTVTRTHSAEKAFGKSSRDR